jgi:branched-chain amino acid transport system substrate-binding protein
MIRPAEIIAVAAVLFLGATASLASAEKKYGPGASDTEIKIGQTMPHSGPQSAVSVIGRSESAYFEMINK